VTAAISLAKRELIAVRRPLTTFKLRGATADEGQSGTQSSPHPHEVDAQRFVFKQENRRWSLFFCELQRSLHPSA
jgi:hypothetical protein